ncbi:MAG: multidrug ABC transporter ATP-binding protein [Acidobacteria bacterium]|nr:MAG: multidrug ABC transporter ATP-binding protein [Acidobacteriota bacterium]
MSKPESKTEQEPLVHFEALVKQFSQKPSPALDKIDGDVLGGRVTGLVGPDGAGKTTLIRLMAGLLLPTGGELKVLGCDPTREAEEIHDRCGYMPQRFGLYEDLTVLQNLNLYADLRSVIGDERKSSFEKLLAFTDLKRFSSRKAAALSGGMKQKLGLACALLSRPELLLLDEPSVGVDPISRRELWGMVQDLVKQGIGVVWSTAYLDEAEKCDEVILLNEGKKIFGGKPEDLTNRVDRRTFLIEAKENRRQILTRALRQENVVDGVVQGSNLRLVFKKEPGNFQPDSVGAAGAKLQAVKPRFEDAFIDVLGGIPKEESAVAKVIEPLSGQKESVIEAEGLTKRFGDFTAADNITFSVERGEIFGLLGPNGAGKSTTFKMLCGLLRPTGGTAKVAGYSLDRSASKARNRIGYMAQKFSLYSDLTIMQNLEFFSGIYGLSGRKQKTAIESMVSVFNFENYLNFPAGELPLGYKQRLAMACSLMHSPDVLFLDEPTSGVDPITRREFWTHINALVEKGRTIMVTTHFMDEAEYCDRLALIYRGKMIAHGAPDDLKREARSADNENPTMEDAFIALVRKSDQDRN